jgi:ABC-2 type transport system ATP-binding protein
MEEEVNKQVSAVEVRGLTKKFLLEWTRKRLIALENLDLDIPPGSIFGLLGPNGSGKSTTMKLMLGLIRPSAGEVRIFGHPAGSVAAREKIGFLPENPYFPHYLTGREFLGYCGKLCGMRGPELTEKVDQLLERVAMTDAGRRRLKTYSKGMLQRIGLAQALIHDPALLVLDEPTSGVDPQGSRFIRDLMLQLKEEGRTIIFSSHLLEQVEAVSEQVAILHRGKKIQEGSLTDLLSVPDRLEIQVDWKGGRDPETVRELLEKEGMTGLDLHRPRMTLEDYFLNEVYQDGGKKK